MRRINILPILFFVGIISVLNSRVEAQIVINEFLASNSGLITDPDFNESGDWVELYNGYKYYSTSGVGEWLHTDENGIPFHILNGNGFVSWIYSFKNGKIYYMNPIWFLLLKN